MIVGAKELTTLKFLVAGSLPRTLTTLELRGFSCCLPMDELQFVLQLRELHSLTLLEVFDGPLRAEDEWLLTPPSQTLLHLAKFKFVYHYGNCDTDESEEELDV